MTKLPRRYSEQEFARLSEAIKPVERWTAAERRAWLIDCYGFRHFAAPNITPIEHYWPKHSSTLTFWRELVLHVNK
jgi:hypothetical protein